MGFFARTWHHGRRASEAHNSLLSAQRCSGFRCVDRAPLIMPYSTKFDSALELDVALRHRSELA